MVQSPPAGPPRGPGKPPNDDDDATAEATRILFPQPGSGHGAGQSRGEPQAPSADDGATRILPVRSPIGQRPAGQGAVIGVAGGQGRQQSDDEGRTMFMPVGMAHQQAQQAFDPAVAWLVIVEGPGRGHHCPVYYGQNSIGRGADQRIRLGFGDTRIARDAHAFLIYDDVARKYYLRDNGKANLVRLNGAPVMTPTQIKDRDRIQIGETVMLFVPLCGESFDWLATEDEGPSTAPGA